VTTATGGFVHPALLYRDAEEYLAGTLPFIRDGLAAGEPVAVAVPTANLRLLREALGGDAARVLMKDMTVAGRNPGRIIPTVLLAFANANPGRRVRIIGEPIWAGRTATEYPACAQHEALINAAFAGRPATIVCPYNTALLDPVWLHDAHRTHPLMLTAARRWDSPHYADPAAVAADFNRPLPDPPVGAATMTVDLFALPAVRRFVTEQGARAGLPPERVADLTLAVHELAANAVAHGGGTGELAVWTHDDHLICQLSDAGRLTDPLVGRIPVLPDTATSGRGLLLVNELCDLVRVHTSPAGTTIRIHLRREPATGPAASRSGMDLHGASI
jgi:anti-sigma regulatory factor (Ser/Thr protein kinase)